MATSGLEHVVTPAVIEAMEDGTIRHLMFLARMRDGSFTWESDEGLTVGEAQVLCEELLRLTKQARPPSCRRGCGR